MDMTYLVPQYGIPYCLHYFKEVKNITLESTRPRGRLRNRWQDEVREDGRIVGGEEW
jgi:hypothetical protein